jgi:hypothetical protein
MRAAIILDEQINRSLCQVGDIRSLFWITAPERNPPGVIGRSPGLTISPRAAMSIMPSLHKMWQLQKLFFSQPAPRGADPCGHPY